MKTHIRVIGLHHIFYPCQITCDVKHKKLIGTRGMRALVFQPKWENNDQHKNNYGRTIRISPLVSNPNKILTVSSLSLEQPQWLTVRGMFGATEAIWFWHWGFSFHGLPTGVRCRDKNCFGTALLVQCNMNKCWNARVKPLDNFAAFITWQKKKILIHSN